MYVQYYLIFFIILKNLIISENNTLQFVQVLFRHGDRTTDPNSLYPNDPYRNETFYPYGIGQLTNIGKQREYKLGKLLRKRYNNFLNKTYYPDVLEAISSNINRAKVSMLLVLAGLYPPISDQKFEKALNWQPIPYNSVPIEEDRLFFGFLCGNFEKLLKNYIQTPKIQQQIKYDRRIFRYLSKKTGWKNITYYKIFLLYAGLKTEKELGFKIPSWARLIYKKLQVLSMKYYDIYTGTEQLIQQTAGNLLKYLVNNIQLKINGKLDNRKLILLSGHEFNIVFLQKSLGVFKRHTPPYGAHLMLELHKIDGIFGIKLYYEDYKFKQPQLLRMHKCEKFCPLDRFIQLIQNKIPSDNTCD